LPCEDGASPGFVGNQNPGGLAKTGNPSKVKAHDRMPAPLWVPVCIALAEDLRLEPRLKNACLLLKFGREAMSFEAREFAQRLFEAHHHVLWQDVIENCLAPFTLQHACRMILDGELLIDIDQTLDKATVLSTVKTHQLLEITNG
jgi:hypothetical protein